MLGSISSIVSSGWQYIRSSVERGIEQAYQIGSNISEAFNIDIENVTAYQDLAINAVEAWDKLNQLPDFYKVGSKFGLETPFDFRQDYVMHMKVYGYDKNSEEYVSQWITVESDNPLTKDEWFQLAREATTDTPFGTDLVLEYAQEWEYYVKS